MQTLAVVCSATLLHSVQLRTQAVSCCRKLIHCKCQSPVPVSKSDAWGRWLLGWLAGSLQQRAAAIRCRQAMVSMLGSISWQLPLQPAACAMWFLMCCAGCLLCTMQKGSRPDPFLSASVHGEAEPCLPPPRSTVARTLSPLKSPGLVPGASNFLCLWMY